VGGAGAQRVHEARPATRACPHPPPCPRSQPPRLFPVTHPKGTSPRSGCRPHSPRSPPAQTSACTACTPPRRAPARREPPRPAPWSAESLLPRRPFFPPPVRRRRQQHPSSTHLPPPRLLFYWCRAAPALPRRRRARSTCLSLLLLTPSPTQPSCPYLLQPAARPLPPPPREGVPTCPTCRKLPDQF
jgi:hypothetical protein